ncbi:hypothetical protein EDD86DRAFT_244605 [Gorgonomyces haynaldii]|nr:hypothetical protein EDD86DRAFT_244605 [Gorgonomyces haynaldii]
MSVLVTGFGPFRRTDNNPSWIAARHLPDKLYGLEIVKEEVLVEYAPVKQQWKQHLLQLQPKMVIHMGLGHPGPFRIETKACNGPYVIPDVKGQKPTNGTCCDDTDTLVLDTLLDFKTVHEKARQLGIDVELSYDAGKYLCEFIYFTSMECFSQQHLRVPTVFIHMPPPTPEFGQDKINHAIQTIVTLCVSTLTS